MIGTNERRELNNIYNSWMCGKNKLESTSGSLILWLQTHGMLSEEGVKRYIKHNAKNTMEKTDVSKSFCLKDFEMVKLK